MKRLAWLLFLQYVAFAYRELPWEITHLHQLHIRPSYLWHRSDLHSIDTCTLGKRQFRAVMSTTAAELTSKMSNGAETRTRPAPPDRNISTRIELMEYSEIEKRTNELKGRITDKCLNNIPGWSEFDDNDVLVKHLTGGLSNSLFTVEIKPERKLDARYHRKVLIRFYGTESAQFYDPEDELKAFKALSDNGAGPRLIQAFDHSRIEEFLEGATCDISHYQRPLVLAQLGGQLAKFHNSITDQSFLKAIGIECDDPCSYVDKFDPFTRMDRWMEQADQAINKTMKFGTGDWEAHISEEVDLIMEGFQHREWTTNPRVIFQEMKSMAKELRESLKPDESLMSSSLAYRLAYRKVFSHNDLHVLNMILSPKGLLSLIDVEYAQIGYAAQDFANVFVESAFNFEVEVRPKFEHDFGKSIPRVGRRQMIMTYLSESGLVDGYPDAELVDDFLKITERFEVYMYLQWGFWALIRAPTNKEFNEDNFDFIAYAFMRFGLAKELMQRLQ